MEILKTSVKSLGVIVLAIILTGCIIRAWRVPPSETEGLKVPPYPSQKESVIYFNVPQLFQEDSAVRERGEDPVSPRVFANRLEHTLIDNPTFGKAVLTSSPPQKGFY